MATPHTLIAILLSHLQALYNNNNILTFVIAISLFLGRHRRCGRHCSSTTAPTGGGQRHRKRRSQRGRQLRRLYCYTKVGSRDRGLVAERGSFELLTNVNREVEYGASFWSCNRTIDSITDSNEPRQQPPLITKRETLKGARIEQIMIWRRLATERALSLFAFSIFGYIVIVYPVIVLRGVGSLYYKNIATAA